MNRNYFNVWEFRRALSLLEKDPISSKVLFEDYLQKYPNDYSAYLFYCSNLIIIGNLELAEKVFDYVQEAYQKDEMFLKSDKLEKFKFNMFFTRIKLLSYQEKYEELYNLYLENINIDKEKRLNSVWFYSKKRTGRLNDEKRDINSYLYKQIIRYEEDEFYQHVEKHLANTNKDLDEPNSVIFEVNFPLRDVVEEIKKYIPSDKKLFWGFYDNIYFFKYDGCGRVDKRLVNYFKVVCLHDSQEFITMCPICGNENLPYIDLNYMNKEESVKVKRISQIDKFNLRYGNK